MPKCSSVVLETVIDYWNDEIQSGSISSPYSAFWDESSKKYRLVKPEELNVDVDAILDLDELDEVNDMSRMLKCEVYDTSDFVYDLCKAAEQADARNKSVFRTSRLFESATSDFDIFDFRMRWSDDDGEVSDEYLLAFNDSLAQEVADSFSGAFTNNIYHKTRNEVIEYLSTLFE